MSRVERAPEIPFDHPGGQAPERASSVTTTGAPEARLLLVSAKDRKALDARLEALARALDQESASLGDVAYTLALGRRPFDHRAAVLVPGTGSAADAIRGDGGLNVSRGVAKPGPSEVVMMFPGQGAQFIGMGRQLYELSSCYRQTFDRCVDFLETRLEFSLRELLLSTGGDADETRSQALTRTALAQPALFVVEYSLARVLTDYGLRPSVLLGHSIGEFAAACLAGVFELEAALELVHQRGRLMQSMPPGAMLAIQAEPDDIADLLFDDIDLAAHNAPGACVISGTFDAIAKAEAQAKAKGLETRGLHTSHAFHSRMMDPILEEFRRAVERAQPRPPELPIISTMTGASLSAAEATSADYWAAQLRNPVRFAQAARAACGTSPRVFVEVGPGVTLMSSVAKLTDVAARPRKLVETLGHPKSDTPAVDAILRCAGHLWLGNVELDWERFYRGAERRFVRLPSYPYTRQRHWIEPPRAVGSAADASRFASSPEHVDPAPDVNLEELILSQVAELLGSRLGRTLEEDDLEKKFLELGMDSLGLSQLAGKLKQQFKVQVPVRHLFERLATPKLLAAFLLEDVGVLASLSQATGAPDDLAPPTRRTPGGRARREPLSEVDRADAPPGKTPSEDVLAAIERRLARIEAQLASRRDTDQADLPDRTDLAAQDAHIAPSERLTASQREIWVSARIGGDAASLGYNECRAFLFDGELDVPTLERSLRSLCERHESLRLTFSPDGETRRVSESLNLSLEHADLREPSDSGDREARFVDLMRAQVTCPFDLARGPLIRGVLVRLKERETALVLCAHHIVVDGSSWEILIRELAELYSAEQEGRPPSLPPAESFASYARLEHEYLRSSQASQDQAFWLKHLEGQSEDLNLPTDRPRPAQRTYSATRSDHHLSQELVSQVRAAAAAAGCTPQTFLFAAFQVLLFRLSRQQDIICGVPTSGQAAAGMDPLVGHCVHVLPLRLLIDPEKSLAAHIREVHRVMLDGLEHQRATFSELLPLLARPRDPSRPALIQAAFGMGRSQKRPRFAGLETALRVVPRVSETFDLYVYATEDRGKLEVSWSYNTDLFDRETIELWQRCFATLTSRMASGQLDEPLARVQLLADADRSALLELAQGPVVDRGAFTAVPAAISRQAATTPDAIALVDRAGAYSYAELESRANRVAHYLVSQRLPKGSLVAVCLDRDVNLVASLLGVWRAGHGYVPLDPAYPSARVETILEDASAGFVLTSQALLDRIPAQFEPVCLESVSAELDAQPTQVPDVSVEPNDTAYVIFTSGSTGRPKGVQIAHDAFQNFIFSMQRQPGFTSHDTLLALTTICFDISGLELFLPLVCGGKIILATKDQATSPRDLRRLLVDHGATVLQATPATWQMLFDSGWEGDRQLKVLCGGEAFPRHLAEKFLQTCGEVWNVYGPTETTVWSTTKRIRDSSQLSIGRPIDNTTCYVLDEHRDLVPRGTAGELWIGGQGVALGYLGRPDLTSERFVASPFKAGERIYRTGDLARVRTDGDIECLGRVDFQVKIRGFRIELGEVETALLEHRDVQACVAVAREDQPGEKILVGYLVPREGATIEIEALRRFVAERLPAYMVPSAYCVLDALPMTPNKKVDRNALPKPMPSANALQDATKQALPRDELERAVLELWADTLRYPQLQTTDNFYAVGGESLMAIRLIDRINQKFGTDLPVNDLFNHPTVAGLSELIRHQTGGDVEPESEKTESVPRSVRGETHRGLFQIQRGNSRRIPLFLIHGDSANGLLPPVLGEDQPIWGYHHQGSDGGRIQFQTVESLAVHCHQEWLTKNGRQPCILSGHSFGALVAYHVAVLRQRDGLETPRLILIDARHPSALAGRQNAWGPRKIKRQLKALRRQWDDVTAVRAAEDLIDRGLRVPLEERTNYILSTYRLATRRYHPPNWRGELEVIRSKEWTALSPSDNWEHSAVGTIRRIVIEGTHLSIVREAHGVELVGKVIRRICDELAESGGG